MIDFTGKNCVNCRKMENIVWSVESVHKIMANDFIIASLYVDDNIALPAPEVSEYSGRELETWGDKWADMQSVVYKKNSQPQYVTLDQNGGMMNSDASYMSHGTAEVFEEWLNAAKAQYKRRGTIPVVFGNIEYAKTDTIVQ